MFTDKLREGSTGPVAKFLFIIIMVSFAIAGVGTYLAPKIDLNPAKVNGRSISSGELEQQFRLEKNRLERQLGNSFREQARDPAFNAALRKQTLERMITDQVVSDHIYNSGVVVSDDLVKTKIREMPEFQVNGKFSDAQFKKVLSLAGYPSPLFFSEALKGDIAKEIYLKTAFDSGFALPDDVAVIARIQTQERTFRKIDMALDSYKKNQTASDAEIKAYYEAHSKDFLLPEKVKVSYIYITSGDFVKDVKYTDEDLKKFFNLHAELYTIPEKRTVSHILITGEDAEEKIAAVAEELKNGASFEELARKYSEDPVSKDKGGRLPAFAQGVMDSSFEKAAFALENKGDVSEPVNTQFGWHLIRLDGIEPGHGAEFEQVRNDVIEQYTKVQSRELYMDKKQIIADTSFENPDSLDAAMLAANAARDEGGEMSKSVQIKTSDFVSSGDRDAVFPLNQPEVQRVMFQNEIRDGSVNSDVVELGDNAMVVLHVEGYKEPVPKPLNDVMNEVRDAVIAAKAEEASGSTLKAVTESLAKSESVEKFVRDGLIVLSEPVTISRIKAGDVNSEVVRNLFAMPVPEKGNVTYKSFTGAAGSYILVLTDVVNPVLPEDSARDSFLNNQIYNFRYGEDNQIVIDSSRAESDIEYNQNREFLKSQEDLNNG
ncbi:SurA N-terminal domain-containing protein [Succinimonas amylolytica]|uniref:SurA N-terminal domain-containing protein n=1 Tax=Succinimonas amylolytica TaxID=83769 RepID=UPI0023A8F95A